MTPEKNDKKLTRWLLAATIALLALVLCLQLWQMFGRKAGNGALAPDSANGPAAPQAAEPLTPPAAGVSQGKTPGKLLSGDAGRNPLPGSLQFVVRIQSL